MYVLRLSSTTVHFDRTFCLLQKEVSLMEGEDYTDKAIYFGGICGESGCRVGWWRWHL